MSFGTDVFEGLTLANVRSVSLSGLVVLRPLSWYGLIQLIDPLNLRPLTIALGRRVHLIDVSTTCRIGPCSMRLLQGTHSRKFDGISETVQNIEDHFNSWNNHLPSGTAVTLEVEDAIGDKATSGTFTIQPSTQTGCL
ncbi:hypothetical protein BC628DRAFT_1405354 [Trametes gibbosa]|nr:hypothetical protein BC628DRAFT_1405354 [Trametes gibbosa]